MKKLFTYIGITLLALPIIHAQTHEERAKQIFDFYIAGQGDSVHIRLSEEMRTKIVPAVFNDSFRDLERQFGKYQSNSEWKTDEIEGTVIHYTDVQFEKYPLRFFTAFNDNGLAHTLRLVPIPETVRTAPVLMNNDVIEEKEVIILSEEYKLPGTLTLPKGKEKVPAVILVHGSGPQGRDATIGPNKVFRDLAWGISEQNIAVLRYDKRTYVYRTAKAATDYDSEVVDDVLAAIELLKNTPEIDPEQIYVAGHSLGGLIAPRIAERSGEKLAGIILIAAPVRPMEDMIVEQATYISSLTDSTEKTQEAINQLKAQAANVKAIGTTDFDENIGLPLNVPIPYWEFANAYQPVEVARKLQLPILILQGERDYQVTMEDYSRWRFGLFRNPNVMFKLYPKLNHMLQEGSGKSTPSEYNQENAAPAYFMKDIADWILHKRIEE